MGSAAGSEDAGKRMPETVAIEDFDDPHFNPFIVSEQVAGQGAVADIYGEIRRLRAEAPVWEIDPRVHFGTAPDLSVLDRRKIWVLGHRDVQAILVDPKMWPSAELRVVMEPMFGETITQMDGLEHRRYRALFQQAFAPNMLDGWREHLMPRIVNELIDHFADRRSADLVGEFALHFPFQFITELLALPASDRAVFHKLAFAQTTSRYDPLHAAEAGRKLSAYLQRLIEHRRQNPPSADDFVHVMASATIEGESLPEIVIVSFLRQLMNAAGDTSYHGFSNLMAALMSNPDQFDAIRSDRSHIPQAVEEALRWEAPIVNLERSPAEEVELHGIVIRPGDRVYASIGGANRDESVYDEPDRFDLFRRKQRHMAFGQGPHICIGQHLARVEMIVALNALIDRLPGLRLDPEAPPPTVFGVSLRKPKAVQVVFD